ncbi:phosphopantetheine-binding protein [Microbispora triticiradicis]|uniref:phosphopantetheine-binding protein n=1 Tax=Microbispora triticiradicis TaxID=2200763 RepID=UPI001AD6A949|nr:phosphopantetheine-binding protein [Microbispora triticiradicis]MBO4270188.1 acyl carrier protein [Microbispora triticiradicis]
MLRERLAELVSKASGGDLAAADVLAADCSLPALGLNSLAYLRLIDMVETEFGCDVDLDGGYLDTLDGLAGHIAAHTGEDRDGGGDSGGHDDGHSGGQRR